MPPKNYRVLTLKKVIIDALEEIGQTLSPPKGPNPLASEILSAWIKLNKTPGAFLDE